VIIATAAQAKGSASGDPAAGKGFSYDPAEMPKSKKKPNSKTYHGGVAPSPGRVLARRPNGIRTVD
jgi:hypothetical protein